MTDFGLDETRNEKEQLRNPYDLSRNTDMKQTCIVTRNKTKNEITTKKTNIDTTEMNVQYETVHEISNNVACATSKNSKCV